MAILNSQIELKAPLELDIRKSPLESVEVLAKYKHMEYAYDGLEVTVLNNGLPIKFIAATNGEESVKKYHWKVNSIIVAKDFSDLKSLSENIVDSLSTTKNRSKAFTKGQIAVVMADENREGGKPTQYIVESFTEEGYPEWRDIVWKTLEEALIPEGAKEALDTLKEIADWIQSHPDDAADMNTRIKEISGNVETLTTELSWKTAKGESTGHFVNSVKLTMDEFEGLLKLNEVDQWTKYYAEKEDGTIIEYVGNKPLSIDCGLY